MLDDCKLIKGAVPGSWPLRRLFFPAFIAAIIPFIGKDPPSCNSAAIYRAMGGVEWLFPPHGRRRQCRLSVVLVPDVA